MKKYKLFLDMDQCLVNFNKQFKKDTGYTDIEYVHAYSKSDFDERVRELPIEWWENLEWMSDGKELYNYTKKYNPIILSAHLNSKNTIEGKERWLKRELPDIQYYIVLVKTKQKYAAENYILIDDNKNNIRLWKEAGGIGILHTNAKNSIQQLKEIMTN